MQLDLNNPIQFTTAGVSALIASVDDSINRQLRVTINGIAYISNATGGDDLDEVAFRFETWCAGNNYLGIAAAADEDWINRIYNALRSNWPKPEDTFLDVY